MTNDPRLDPKKLEQFLEGELSTEESRRLIAWAQSQPEWANSILDSVATGIDAEQSRPRLRATAARRQLIGSRKAPWIVALAAATVFAIFGGIRFYSGRVPSPAPSPLVRTYVTERGQRASVQLSDGSAIQLGPQSTLRIAEGFGTTHRAVALEGDGYFHVIHDASRPFIVRTIRGEVRDVGTRFVVRARDSSSRVDVAVSEGIVTIGKATSGVGAVPALGSDSVLVTAGEIATLDEAGQSAPLAVRDIDRYFAWTRGQLVFDRTPLNEVLRELNRWFAEDFVLSEPALGRIRLTTVLHGETLDEALLVLETSLDMDVRRTGGKVVLRRRAAADTSVRR